MNDYNISIEGEFIDSFIYSGYLFLLDINFSLNIYKWDNLAKTALKQLGFMQKKYSADTLVITVPY